MGSSSGLRGWKERVGPGAAQVTDNAGTDLSARSGRRVLPDAEVAQVLPKVGELYAMLVGKGRSVGGTRSSRTPRGSVSAERSFLEPSC